MRTGPETDRHSRVMNGDKKRLIKRTVPLGAAISRVGEQ